MKKVYSIIFIILVSFISCQKKDNVKDDIDILTKNNVLENEKIEEIKKIEMNIENREVYTELEYQKYNEQIMHNYFTTPFCVSSEDIKNYEVESQCYNGISKKIKAYNFEYDERYCTCKYTITSLKGHELEYSAIFKKDPLKEEIESSKQLHPNAYYDFDPDRYYLVSINILSEIEPKQLVYNEDVMSSWSVIDMMHDENKDNIISVLESYQNSVNPFYSVIDYVKADFTGSGYDEYLVLYGSQNRKDISLNGKLVCILLDDNKFVNSYDISLIDFAILDQFDIKKISYNFGYLFSHGIVDDYNSNGLNEIYFFSPISSLETDLYCIEFNGENFDVYFWVDGFSSRIYTNKQVCIIDIEKQESLFAVYDHLEEYDIDYTFYASARVNFSRCYVEDYNEWILKAINYDYSQFNF